MIEEEKRRKRNETQRRYYKRNREKILEKSREQGREYYRKYPERIRENRRRGYKRNRERILKTKRRTYQKLRRQVLGMMGNKCVVCGFNDFRALQIDHISGGGRKELKKLTPGGVYRKIRDNPHLIGIEYQLLCANHNQIKKHERNNFY